MNNFRHCRFNVFILVKIHFMNQHLLETPIIERKKLFMHLLVLAILTYFIVFLKLNAFHIRWWDESIFAVNTYEMLYNGKLFTPYFRSLPDFFNTKPPLTIWFQLLFVKLIGYNELAIRLPSAIAAALCILLLFNFIATRFSMVWAWLSALILLTSPGFIDFHTARTGDSDSLLTLFLLIAHFHFFDYLFTQKQKHIFYFILFISLAFATKSIAGLLFTPAYLIILLYQKKLKVFLSNSAFLSGLGLFLFIILALIGLRNQQDPTYIRSILFEDLGRVVTVIQNHQEPFIFYFENLFTTRFSTWFILLVIGCGLAFYTKQAKEKIVLQGFTMLILVYLAITSISITKLIWYDMPLFPYFAVLAAYPIYLLIQKLELSSAKQLVILLILIFIYPYHILFENSQANRMSPGEKALEANERYIFKKEQEENENLNGISVYYTGYDRGLVFYKYKLAEKGQHIELIKDGKFAVNDRVLVCNDSLKLLLSQRYELDTIDRYEQALLFRLNKKKE